MKRWLPILALVAAGCTPPNPAPPPPALLAPTITGVYTAPFAPAAPAAAVPTTVWTGLESYGVMLCEPTPAPTGPNYLCWYPPK